MKRIEAIIARSALDDFHRCARNLGIFGFDLSVPKARLCDHQRLPFGRELRSVARSRIKVDFAVLDDQTNPTVHTILESVHPESIGIFRFDEDVPTNTTAPTKTLNFSTIWEFSGGTDKSSTSGRQAGDSDGTSSLADLILASKAATLKL